MLIPFRKIFFIMAFNMSLFLILMIGIQNSYSKKKVNFIFAETVYLPISFIVGISFISGSLTGNLLKMNLNDKNWLIYYKEINLSKLIILEIPLFNSWDEASLKTLVLGTLITFCSLLQSLFASFNSE